MGQSSQKGFHFVEGDHERTVHNMQLILNVHFIAHTSSFYRYAIKAGNIDEMALPIL